MEKFERLSLKEKIKICKICQKQYKKPKDWSNQSWLNSKYCSNQCRSDDPDYQKIQAENISKAQMGRILPDKWRIAISNRRKGMKFSKTHCENIGKIRKGKPTWNKNKKGLQVAWNKGKSNWWVKGEKNPNWKGGITPENHKIRTSLEVKFWRKAVFERDNFICQKCGIKGGKLVAHHIDNFADFPELRFAIDNGITLSEKAHKEFHKKYGQRNNTEEQLKEFLCE